MKNEYVNFKPLYIHKSQSEAVLILIYLN